MKAQATVAVALVASVAFPAPVLASHGGVVDKLYRGPVERVSVSTSQAQGDGASGRGCSASDHSFSASDDGRYIAFTSSAGNLDPADTNGTSLKDVFVHDRKKQQTRLVSVLPSGLAPSLPSNVLLSGCYTPGTSMSPAISGNGRYVAFVSSASIIDAKDIEATVPVPRVYLHDLKKGTTEMVSRTSDGRSTTVEYLTNPDISDDGRFVVFTSDAAGVTKDVPSVCTNPADPLSPGALCVQTYVRDMKTKQTFLVSKSSEGEPANHHTLDTSLSGDGQTVAFETHASNLVDNDINQTCASTLGAPSCSDVFVHDMRAGDTELVSVSREGLAANGTSQLNLTENQGVSQDGRFVGFYSTALDIVPNNPAHANPIVPQSAAFVRDLKTDRTRRVSVTSAGELAGNNSPWISLSDDGRFAAWHGWACPGALINTDPLCTHTPTGTFIQDRETGQVDWYQALPNAWRETPPQSFYGREIGGDGTFIVGVEDVASSGYEADTNGLSDVFVRDLELVGTGADPNGVAVSGSMSSLRGPTGHRVLLDDADDDAALKGMGGEILEARVVRRPALRDIYLSIELDRLPTLSIGGVVSLPQIFGFRLRTQQSSYELRASGFGGPTAMGRGTFTLFRCEASCTEVVALRGGYGTVGESVVAAIPLRYLASDGDPEITSVEAFSAIGTLDAGALTTLDVSRTRD